MGKKKSRNKNAELYTGLSFSAYKTSQHFNEHQILNSSRGHGFAAEKINNLSDVLKGNDAKIVGANNLKAGPDRVVNGEYIQTKYYQSADQSVGAMFENGKYKYINPDGTPMPVEVPRDQYEQALRAMENKIRQGQVTGVDDPTKAKDLVREGTATYKQAVNMAKAGTIESLTYDATTGMVIATYAFGISALITFAHAIWSGKSVKEASIASIQVGIKVFGVSFISHVATQQLSRTVVSKSLERSTAYIASNILPKEFVKLLAKGMNPSASVSSVNTVSKVLRGNIITGVVVTTVLSAGDIYHFAKNEISGLQCFKNICITSGSVASGIAGGMAGVAFVAWCISNPAGWVTAAGAIVVGSGASIIGGKTVKALVDLIGPDDAEVLKEIVDKQLSQIMDDYLITESEMSQISNRIQKIDWDKELRKIFSISNRESYCYQLFEPILKEIIEKRPLISI